MKIKIFFAMLAVALFTISCSNDDEVVNPSNLIAGSYTGYTSASFSYSPTPIVNDGEKLVLTPNTDGTASMTFTSNQWGTTTATALTVATATDGSYAFSGTGTAVISGHEGTSSSYTGTISGTISSDKSSVNMTMTFEFMGGTTITFKTGDAPAYLAVSGSYTTHSIASVMGYNMTNNGETITLTPDTDNETAILSYKGVWGEGATTSLTINETANGYELNGEGSIAASMAGTNKAGNYDFSVAGTVSNDGNLDLTFTIALGAMGNVTVKVGDGYAPAADFLPGFYNGYTSAAFSYSPDQIVTDDETVTITANENGTLTLVIASQTWGTTTVNNLAVEIDDDGNYTLSGEGTSLMSMSGPAKEYACQLTGTVTADKETSEFVIMLQIMGGTTITFNLGNAPATE